MYIYMYISPSLSLSPPPSAYRGIDDQQLVQRLGVVLLVDVDHPLQELHREEVQVHSQVAHVKHHHAVRNWVSESLRVVPHAQREALLRLHVVLHQLVQAEVTNHLVEAALRVAGLLLGGGNKLRDREV